jgi:hypothetical protein
MSKGSHGDNLDSNIGSSGLHIHAAINGYFTHTSKPALQVIPHHTVTYQRFGVTATIDYISNPALPTHGTYTP